MYENYSKTRLSPDISRAMVWAEIIRYLKAYFPKDPAILDLGSGYCDFINQVAAKERYALDKYMDPGRYCSSGVVPLFGGVELIRQRIADNSLDVVLASNLFEHLENNVLEEYLLEVRRKLKQNGLLVVIQPNFKLCPREYFDDYTHLKAWSDVSLADYLSSKGFRISLIKKRFLPFSMKSKIPKMRSLIWLYLRFPLKPFAGQMLILARNKR